MHQHCTANTHVSNLSAALCWHATSQSVAVKLEGILFAQIPSLHVNARQALRSAAVAPAPFALNPVQLAVGISCGIASKVHDCAVGMVQVRDMTGRGEVVKRRMREGRGQFPMDCPLDDSRLQIHYRCTSAHP